MIYVIYVQSGREHDVVAALRDKNINAYAPAHDLLERKGGVWRLSLIHISEPTRPY